MLNVPYNIIHFNRGISLHIKRLDMLNAIVSGNKFYKLKYNLIEAKKNNHNTLLTFGGAYSNHIEAVAVAGKKAGLKTVGIIRGEEIATKINDNPTLTLAKNNGMQLHFVTRKAYKQKDSIEFKDYLKHNFGKFYCLPEGGTNALAVKGCREIVSEEDAQYSHICCPVGTGGTMAGIINASKNYQQVIGFSVLKADNLQQNICKFANKQNGQLNTDYNFGGYAKINLELITFINTFKKRHNIALDPIYTGKMLYGIMELIKQNYFISGSKLLVIHTGGLQGIAGINLALKKKQWPIIN